MTDDTLASPTDESTEEGDAPGGGSAADGNAGGASASDPVVISWKEETPPYLKPRFLVGIVVLTLLCALVLVTWGNVGSPAPDTGARATVPVVAARTGPKAGTVADCPASGASVNVDAAKAIRLFLAAAAGQNLAGLQVADDVKAVLAASAPNPAVARMTRTHGFLTDGGNVSTCVQSYWLDGGQVRTSTDMVTVSPTAKGWQVTQWTRGEPSDVMRNDSSPLAFYNGNGSCGTPDRIASVQLPAGTPSERLRTAVEELASGSAGRALGAASTIPADVQVVSASVDGLSARVELTPTADKVNDCTGRAAVQQIKATATAIALAALPPDQTTTSAPSKKSSSKQPPAPQVAVEVVVNGSPVTSLRP